MWYGDDGGNGNGRDDDTPRGGDDTGDDDQMQEKPYLASGPLGELQHEWQRMLDAEAKESQSGDLSQPSYSFPLPDEDKLDLPPYLDEQTPDDWRTTRTLPENAGAAPPEGPSSVARRYDDEPNPPPPSTFQSGTGEGETGMSPHGYADNYRQTALQVRRLEDERATGRHWPAIGTNYPGSPRDPHEAQYMGQLAVALGEVDPHVLARESALRYVRASLVGGEDHLAPTDIFSIMYYGLGLTIRPLDCTSLPQVLAVYHRQNRDLYLDWQLLKDPPTGRAVLDPSAWRRAVDSSQLARFLLAWCVAIHLTDNYGIPLVLGFVPGQTSVAPAGTEISADTYNRYRNAMEAVGSLLAPVERLWQQIGAMGWQVRPGDPEWRNQVRRQARFNPNPHGSSQGFSYPPGNQGPMATSSDPIDQFLAALADRNNCPSIIVKAQMDGVANAPDWTVWSQCLLREIPALAMRQASATKAFNQANMRGQWGSAQPATPSGSATYARLSL